MTENLGTEPRVTLEQLQNNETWAKCRDILRKNKHAPLPGKTPLTTHNSGHSIIKPWGTTKCSSSYELKQRNTAKQANMFDMLFFPLSFLSSPSLFVGVSATFCCPDSQKPPVTSNIELGPFLWISDSPFNSSATHPFLEGLHWQKWPLKSHIEIFVSKLWVTEKIKVILQFILWCEWLMKVRCVSPPKDICTFQSGHWIYIYTLLYIK